MLNDKYCATQHRTTAGSGPPSHAYREETVSDVCSSRANDQPRKFLIVLHNVHKLQEEGEKKHLIKRGGADSIIPRELSVSFDQKHAFSQAKRLR